jgi:FtsP/CotA-like multicopper oxidase with cupredoxin domain
MRAPYLRKLLSTLTLLACCTWAAEAGAAAFVQCPGDANGDAVPDVPNPAIKCMHLSAGDGFARMGDGRVLYTFGFSDLTGVPLASAIGTGILAANFPAPTIELQEGQKFYLTLTNVGMAMRPDLFDPHSVHFHGFPNQAPIFDGLPETSLSINMGASLTYFFNPTEPGTYMYHCHVEATEHMQMGMLGNLYVHPAQNGTPKLYGGRTYTKFVYNDGDGASGYNKEFALQLGGFDHVFHEVHLGIQPLPFANMRDTYAMINGRGYPDTVNPAPLTGPVENGNKQSQKVSSLITLNRATEGEKILLRLSDLNVTKFYTVTALGLPMRVVGGGARLARGPDGKDLAYDTTSVTLGGGEAMEVIIDTAGVPAGTYFLYTTNLNYLSNNDEDFGGMMTEIVIL